MPTFPIKAIDLDVSQNLDEGASAGQYRVSYDQVDASPSPPRWDETYYNAIRPYRGESDPDLVEIFAEADGHDEMLIRGVVDRSARAEEGGVVRGVLTGRDLTATLLDRYPSSAFTIQGATVDSNGNLVFNKTFITAVQQLMEAAGVPVFFDSVTDYKLGASIAVTTDRTFGQYLADLLTPLRWSEKHAVDTWWEGNTLFLVGRDGNFRGTRAVDAARLLVDEVERTAPAQAADVRVEGWTFERPVADIPSAGPVAGQSWTTSFIVNYPVRTITVSVAGRTEVYTIEESEYYNRNGQLYATYKKIVYLTKIRTEVYSSEITFDEDPTHKSFRAKLRQRETFNLTDLTPGNTIQDVTVRDAQTEWTYFDDNGDTRTMTAIVVEKPQSGTVQFNTSPEKTTVTRETYRRSAGYIWKETETLEEDPVTGAVNRFLKTEQVGPFRLDFTVGGGAAPTPGLKMEKATQGAGAATSPIRYQSDLLGDQTSIDAIRAHLLDEHASIRRSVRFHLFPKLDIKVGNRVDVASPPSWWDVSSGIFVTGVRFQKRSGIFRMDVEGLTWFAA